MHEKNEYIKVMLKRKCKKNIYIDFIDICGPEKCPNTNGTIFPCVISQML